MSGAEQEALAMRFQQGDINAYKQLRRSYQRSINTLVQKWKPQHERVTTAQLKMTAEWQFPHIVMGYDPTHEKGSTLFHYVNTYMNRYLQNETGDAAIGPHVSRTYHSQVKEYEDAIRESKMEFGPNPTGAQIAKHMPKKFAPEDLERLRRLSFTSTIGDDLTENEEGSAMRFRDQFTGVDVLDHPDAIFQDMRLERIKEIMRRRLTPVEYHVVEDRIIKNEPMATVALRYRMSSTKLRAILAHWNVVKREEGLV